MPDEKEKPTQIDINDLSLVGEEVEVTEDDPFAVPPPPDEGEHLAALQPIASKDFVQAKDKTGRAYIAVPVQSRLLEPGKKHDNWPLFDNFVSTLIRQSTGTCRMAGVLRACGVAIAGRLRDIELARKLHEVSQGKPTVKVTTRWRGYCANCDKNVLTGASKFPPDGKGGRKSTVPCPECGGDVVAQAEIVRYSLAQ